jgi:HEPN domain-containing protein
MMPPEPGSPADWMRHARSDLAMACAPASADILKEALCFHAQQAAEKGIKAVLLARGISFPRTHNLTVLMDLIPHDIAPSEDVRLAAGLSLYAVTTRYPGDYELISDRDYSEAIRLAQAVVSWANSIIGP